MPEPRGRRGRRGPAGEESFRTRAVNGATFFTSRQEHEDLTIVVERFPGLVAASTRTYLLVHGLGVSSRYFRPLAAELAKTGRVFLVDLPGYGAAPNPRRDVTLTDHAAVLAGFVREAGLDNPIIIGHSMGTQIVSLLAQKFPDVTDRIVMMAPTLVPRARTPWLAIRNLLWDATREPPVVFGIAITDYLIRCGMPYLLRQLPHMINDRLEDRVGADRARTLVINGDRDTISPTPWAEALAAAHPDAAFHEVRGPHVIMYTDPVMIAKHITDFADAP
ncbi:MAG: alpha/beta hydrolase [Pseudolysinimonas sp.]|uniref:alpha/beta fold hydrolase n=1 Tax=Pseudolysinimonas sp. TaxID=2680009 RepID=UPI003266F46D